MAALGRANSRIKDFYDVWVLVRAYEFTDDGLARARLQRFSWNASTEALFSSQAFSSRAIRMFVNGSSPPTFPILWPHAVTMCTARVWYDFVAANHTQMRSCRWEFVVSLAFADFRAISISH
jgi:hypothetical protein